ncbi:hypothetical protein MCOR31_011299 [Pyricularia oryzae]|nr:hypothetical protein MCOR31_011299 [Pyricularia oryzae]KAI6404487.1 hypothetical protein MCOR24_007969 [Pyricularia oryzae]
MNAALADENDPLLGAVAEQHVRHAVTEDPDDIGPDSQESGAVLVDGELLEFDPKGDPDNPMEWAPAFKWSIVSLLALFAFCITFTCISVVPVASQIVRDLDGDDGSSRDSASRAASAALLVTIWELGEAAGPLLIAPLSEIYGRWPVINGANILFVLTTVLAATCRRTDMFIAARAMTGAAVATNVLNPAIVGDMFVREERGKPMSLCIFAPMLGGAVGPMLSGAVAQTLGWRSFIWISAGLAAGCELIFLCFFRETYKVAILKKRRTAAVGEAKERSRRVAYGTVQDCQKVESPASNRQMLYEAILRPGIVLWGSGVLLALAFAGSISFSYFYIISVTLPELLAERYGMTPVQTGASLLSWSCGGFIAIFICNRFLDSIYIKLRDSNNGRGLPEYRLPLVVLGAVTVPLATAGYGWSAELRLPLPVLLGTVVLMGVSIMLTAMPLMAYVVDAFGVYSASAITGVIILRCLMGAFLPLMVAPLVRSLGWGWAFICLAGLIAAVAPIPILILRYGERWRAASRYSRDA